MEEKVLKKSKNGLAMVTMFILLYAAAIAAIIVGSIMAEQAETKAGWIVLIGCRRCIRSNRLDILYRS